jgi:hypothetical protein
VFGKVICAREGVAGDRGGSMVIDETSGGVQRKCTVISGSETILMPGAAYVDTF